MFLLVEVGAGIAMRNYKKISGLIPVGTVPLLLECTPTPLTNYPHLPANTYRTVPRRWSNACSCCWILQVPVWLDTQPSSNCVITFSSNQTHTLYLIIIDTYFENEVYVFMFFCWFIVPLPSTIIISNIFSLTFWQLFYKRILIGHIFVQTE